MLFVGCAATLGLLAWHCADDPAGVSAEDLVALLKDGRTQGYAYSALDTSGTELVRGVLFVTMEDSTRLSGFWDLTATGNGQGSIGPQIGSGTLEGFREGAEIQINLNPDYADNNVFLLGTMSPTGFDGIWQYVGFPGVLASGRFRAVAAR